MTRVLLTGANGFVGFHVLTLLREHGYQVTAAVRSQEKAEQVKAVLPRCSSEDVDFVIVPDACDSQATNAAVQHDPPFEAVIHCASPVNYDVSDIEKELLQPAIEGIQTILRSTRLFATSVKQFIMTSSFAAVEDPMKGARPEHTYSEEDWCPMTYGQALEHPVLGYMYSKKISEKVLWDQSAQGSRFSVTALNPPLVFGPVIQPLGTDRRVNLSNELIHKLISGEFRTGLPPTQPFYWVDVRDLALAHVQALSNHGAAGHRFIIAAGAYSNKEVCDIIRKHFPGYAERLPPEDTSSGTLPPGGVAELDLSRAEGTFDIRYRSLESSVVDVVRSVELAGLVSVP